MTFPPLERDFWPLKKICPLCWVCFNGTRRRRRPTNQTRMKAKKKIRGPTINMLHSWVPSFKINNWFFVYCCCWLFLFGNCFIVLQEADNEEVWACIFVHDTNKWNAHLNLTFSSSFHSFLSLSLSLERPAKCQQWGASKANNKSLFFSFLAHSAHSTHFWVFQVKQLNSAELSWADDLFEQ